MDFLVWENEENTRAYVEEVKGALAPTL